MEPVWDLRRFADSVSVIDYAGGSLTYAGLERAGQTVAKAVGSRSLVFCLCRNEIGSVVGYVGMMQGSVVPLLLSADIDGILLEKLVRIYRPSHLWVPADTMAGFDGMTVVHEAYGYMLMCTGLEGYSLHDDLALLLTTSGSTGSPKLVRQSYANVRSNAESIAGYLELDARERPITTLPMNYTYGLSIINSHLLVGATLLLTERGIMERDFWDFLGGAGATSFGGVPYTYQMLDRLRFCRRDQPSLRYVTQAGGKLPLELHKRFARWAADSGKRFVVMYGQCEATARMGWLPPAYALEKRGSMGIAIPGGRFRLVADDGTEITEPWVTGELVYEGPNVTLGYAERGEDLALGDERSGTLMTGDMAQIDEDGFFYIVGRRKRFLKVYGNRVNLDEVDRMVTDELGIECASTGTDDHLCIFVTDSAMADVARALVARRTRLNPQAFGVAVVPEIPKNGAGKVLFEALARLNAGVTR